MTSIRYLTWLKLLRARNDFDYHVPEQRWTLISDLQNIASGCDTDEIRANARRIVMELHLVADDIEEAEDDISQLLHQSKWPKQWLTTTGAVNQAIFQLARGRPAQAWNCLKYALPDIVTDPWMQVEAYIVSALVLYTINRCQAANAQLQTAREIRVSANAEKNALLDCLLHEMHLLQALRSRLAGYLIENALKPQPAIYDHAGDTEAVLKTARQHGIGQVVLAGLRLADLSFQLHQHPSSQTFVSLMAELRAAAEMGDVHFQREAALTAALASLDQNRGDLADTVKRLTPEASNWPEHLNIQRDYLQYRHFLSYNQMSLALQAYQHYSNRFFEWMNKELSIANTLPSNNHLSPVDGLELRLPPKYRSVYRWISQNLGKRNLSISEIAAQAGVTERALQNVFRTYLGVTPSEHIRRQRLQQVMDDLSSRSGEATSVFQVSRKYGLSGRESILSALR